MNRLITMSRDLPTPDPSQTVAYTPICLEMHGRQPLELRLTAPETGDAVPIVILSHGYGPSKYIPSKDGYAPLAQFWAERGSPSSSQPTRVHGPADLIPSYRRAPSSGANGSPRYALSSTSSQISSGRPQPSQVGSTTTG